MHVALLGAVAFVLANEPPNMDCIVAAEKGEPLKKEGRLVEARAKLRVCAQDRCPVAVRDFCRKNLDEVQTALPSLVFSVTDAEHRAVPGLRVSVDGFEPTLTEDLIVLVNPGVRVVRVEAPGYVAQERRVEVSVGQKRTPVAVMLVREGEGNAVEVAPAPVIDKPLPPAEPPKVSGRPAWVHVLGAGGLIAGLSLVGVSVGFVVQWQRETACAPACSPLQREAIGADARRIDGFLFGGLALAAVATLLWILIDPGGA